MARKRRVFTEEFKQQAVRRVRERTAIGVTLTQIGREVGVRPELLRRWSQQVAAPGPDGEVVTLAELQRLRRENDTLRQERDFAKRSGGVLRPGCPVSAKFACIAAHRVEFPVVLMCRVRAVSPSGCYAAQQRPPSARAVRDGQLCVAIHAAHQKRRRRYGAPRIQYALELQGERVGTKRVARLMQQEGLRGRRPKRFVHTTDSAHGQPIAPNTLARQCAVTAIPAQDRSGRATSRTWRHARAGAISRWYWISPRGG